MTIPVSTVPAARAFLLAAITSQINDTSVQVFNGAESTDLEDDVVVIGGVQRQSQPLAMVGDGSAHAFWETYTIEVRVSCFRGGGDDVAATVDARAWTLASAVETAVRSDMTLGGNVTKGEPGASHSDGPMWEDEHKGVICDVYVLLNCSAQI